LHNNISSLISLVNELSVLDFNQTRPEHIELYSREGFREASDKGVQQSQRGSLRWKKLNSAILQWSFIDGCEDELERRWLLIGATINRDV
jgi:hypothetical protein